MNATPASGARRRKSGAGRSDAPSDGQSSAPPARVGIGLGAVKEWLRFCGCRWCFPFNRLFGRGCSRTVEKCVGSFLESLVFYLYLAYASFLCTTLFFERVAPFRGWSAASRLAIALYGVSWLWVKLFAQGFDVDPCMLLLKFSRKAREEEAQAGGGAASKPSRAPRDGLWHTAAKLVVPFWSHKKGCRRFRKFLMRTTAVCLGAAVTGEIIRTLSSPHSQPLSSATGERPPGSMSSLFSIQVADGGFSMALSPPFPMLQTLPQQLVREITVERSIHHENSFLTSWLEALMPEALKLTIHKQVPRLIRSAHQLAHYYTQRLVATVDHSFNKKIAPLTCNAILTFTPVCVTSSGWNPGADVLPNCWREVRNIKRSCSSLLDALASVSVDSVRPDEDEDVAAAVAAGGASIENESLSDEDPSGRLSPGRQATLLCSAVFDMFAVELLLTLFHLMGAGVSQLHTQSTHYLLEHGLNTTIAAIILGQHFCHITGGPALNIAYTTMIAVYRRDMCLFGTLASANVLAAIIVSRLVVNKREDEDQPQGKAKQHAKQQRHQKQEDKANKRTSGFLRATLRAILNWCRRSNPKVVPAEPKKDS
eukprot:GHVT01063609.1.p1 GENE.GHVT01063609.1~~GHVT01063609.1.p1  ORF type:complete len:595 (-),score=106.16 GHVT01063609.1:143-1927(-)